MNNKLFDHPFKNVCDNYDKIWGCTLIHSTYYSKTSFIFLSKCKESYTEQMKRQNNIKSQFS